MTDPDFHVIPDAIPPTVSFTLPNENVIIHDGSYQMIQFGNMFEVIGKIVFSWFPLIKIIFSGEIISGGDSPLNHLEELELLIDGNSIGKGRLYYRELPGDNRAYTFEGHSFHCTIGSDLSATTALKFVLPNVRELFGKEIRDTITGNHQDGRFFFQDKDYKVTIDKFSNFTNLWHLLKTRGGFMPLYSGCLEKKHGSCLIKDLKDYLFSIAHFLYFLNGQRTAPLFIEATLADASILHDYPCHNIQIYKQNGCWSDFQWFDDLSLLWQNFRKLWMIEKDRDFLLTVLHWYVEANAGTAYIEGSIILAQTALELIFNWFIVEKQASITKKDAKKKSAEDKIRMILTAIKGRVDIPPSCVELLQIKDITDGPHAFTKIRNALVHGDEYKRVNFLMLVDYNAKFQALKLGRWYIELSLLYIFGYQGRYYNTAFRVNETVPWVI
jgi:hypothetical protein